MWSDTGTKLYSIHAARVLRKVQNSRRSGAVGRRRRERKLGRRLE